MNEQQKEIASQAIAQIVSEASQSREAPKADELKSLAVAAADAMVAAFEKLEPAS